MPMVEDMSAFFNAAEFATQASLDGVSVLGILDQPYARLLDGIASADPAFTLSTAQAGEVTQGAYLEVGASAYRVRSVQHDGTGVTTLVLEDRT